PYAFDSRGRQNETQLPSGTIDRTVFDGLDRPVSTSVGTDESNLVQTAAFFYDRDEVGGPVHVGDSNLTKEIVHLDGGSTNIRTLEHAFDWRDREVASKEGVSTNE